MARIPDAEVETSERYVRQVLQAQREKWGAPLLNHLLYARRPSIFRGVRAMWSGIDSSALLPDELKALVNRRVAFLNGCDF